jgi:hypothetical protein
LIVFGNPIRLGILTKISSPPSIRVVLMAGDAEYIKGQNMYLELKGDLLRDPWLGTVG